MPNENHTKNTTPELPEICAGIRADGVQGLHVEGGTIRGCGIGISAKNSTGSINGTQFIDTQTGVVLEGQGMSISNTVIRKE